MINTAKYFLLWVLLYPVVLLSQEHKYSFYAGSSIGGPMPVVMADSAYARLHHGITAGGQYVVFQKGAFNVAAELSFQFVNLGYGQDIKKDTTVQIHIPMQNGNILTTNINTYYKAKVNGQMKLNFLKAGLTGSWQKNKWVFSAGPMLYCFSGGFDKGLVHVSIGEGGVSGLDDFEQTYSNNVGINPFALEFLLRTEYRLPAGFSIVLQATRALTPFYKKDFDIRGERLKFYTTVIGAQLHYSF